MKTRIAYLVPTLWDHRQLASCRDRWRERYEVRYAGPAAEGFSGDEDVLDLLDRLAGELAGRVEGVTSSSDYPGATLAAAVATRLGLPGSLPQAVLGASHKYYSRRTQRRAAPEATPRFAPIDSEAPERYLRELPFPCFVKPIKGAFSVLSRRIDTPDELLAFLRQPAVAEFVRYLAPFDRLLERFTGWEVGARFFLAEEVLSGSLVTVEGWVREGRIELLGVVDSGLHPTRSSFARFDYPSVLPAEVQERMAEVVRRTVLALGLESTLFNVELIHDPQSGRVSIVEVNPRPCGQFADLYAKVDGVHGAEVALALAAGEDPRPAGSGPYRCAASFPLRVFEPSRVLRAPDDGALRAVADRFPGALVWRECEPGDELADFDRFEDGYSARYAVVNLGGEDREELSERRREVEAMLGFRFEPL